MSTRSTSTPPLSAREAQVLSGLERQKRRRITFDELSSQWGVRGAKRLVEGLVRKHALQRIGKGIYLAVPFRAWGRSFATSPAVAIASLMQGHPYYLGGFWALSLHRLTTQQVIALDVFCERRRPSRGIQNARVTFHAVDSDALSFGITTVAIEGVDVRVSDPERTILDLFEKPRLLGGMPAVIEFLERSLGRVRVPTLVRYAATHGTNATCQRLGFTLDRLKVPSRALAPLRARVRQSRSVLSLIPGRARTGRLDSSWRVVENDR